MNASLHTAILDSLTEGVVFVNREGQVHWMNAAAEKLLGRAPHDLTGLGLDPRAGILKAGGQPMPFEEQPGLVVLRTGQPVRGCEMGIPGHDGPIRWLLVNAEPVTDGEGGIYGVVVSFVDISGRKEQEQKARESEARYRHLVQAGKVGLWDWDLLTNQVYFSPEWKAQIGYQDHEIPHDFAEWQSRVHPEDVERCLAAVRDFVERPRDDYRIEFRFRHRNGHYRWILAQASLLLDGEGHAVRMLGSHIDITDRKKTEEELRRSNTDLEQYAYVASHDLQEPLRTVAGMIQLLERQYRGKLDDKAEEYIRYAVEAVSRMQSLIEGLLAYSRVNRVNRPIEPVDTRICLDAALQNLDASIRETQSCVTAGDLPTVPADYDQLVRLFQNLIGNSIKFRGSEPPRIHIAAVERKDGWQFSVTDNGIGIEPQYFERIFLIFQRLHTRRRYPGTGIGLALCRKIVERHGGSIWVEPGPEGGSTFHFTLSRRHGHHGG